MTKPDFNAASNTAYANHVAVFSDVNRMSTKLLQMPQLDMQALMLIDDEDQLDQAITAYGQSVKSFGQAFVADLGTVSAKLAQSTDLSADVRAAFATQINTVKAQIGLTLETTQLTIDALSGIEPSMQKQMQLQSKAQAVQMAVLDAQRNLFEKVYGFKAGETLADINTAANMTIKDFERYNAMVSYSADLGTLMKEIGPALQNNDILAIGQVADMIADVQQKIESASVAVGATVNMTPAEKAACKEVVAASSTMMTTLRTGLDGLMVGNTDALLEMLQGIQTQARDAIQAQSKYFGVLEAAYAKDAKSAPSSKNDKGGPKQG